MSLLDLTGVKENETFDPLPAGQYRTIVESAQVKELKNGNGEQVEVTFKVLEPARYESRRLWGRFTIYRGDADFNQAGEPVNGAAKNQQIGQGQLKSLMKRGGHKNPDLLESVEELFGLQTITTVTRKTDDYGEKNEVKGFKEVTENNKVTTAPESKTGNQPDIPF
jgi:hypothetical protein